MNTPNRLKEPFTSSRGDVLGRDQAGRRTGQTARIASVVAGGVLTLLPISAKAETQPLGVSTGDDLPASLGYNPQLSKGVPKDRFDLFISGFENDGPDNIYGEAFKAESKPGSKDINIKALSKIAVVPGIPPAGTYFPITNADGTTKHQVIYDGYISVGGNTKYALSICNDYPENVHPTKTGIKILLYNTGTTKGKNVLRVDDLDADNYCNAPVDMQESTNFQPEAIPEIEFELEGQTHKLRGMAVYKEIYDKFVAQVNLDGVPYDRDASDPNNIKWISENPIKGNTDFVETEWLNAFTAVETQDGRKLIVGAIDAGNVKFIVFEPKIDLTTGAVILEECPIDMGEPDPFAPPLDDDGDGIPNKDDTCVGYNNPDPVDKNADGIGDDCQAKCDKYANQVDMTLSDSLPCSSEKVGYEKAKQLKDGSYIHYSGNEPILADDGTIIGQQEMSMRYIHTTLVGAVDAPEPARNVSLPDGYETEIKVNSGTAHVTGTDFLGNPVDVTVTKESGSVNLGFMYGAEVGIEGSDIELIVGSEYKPCQSELCQSQNPEPAQAEPPPAQAEPPPVQAEPPMPQAEPTAEPATAEEMPDAGAETVEENGGVVVPPEEPLPAEPTPDAAVYVDAPVYADYSPDVPQTPDTSADPDTPQGQDAPVDSQLTDTTPDTPQNPDTATGTDTSADLKTADWTPGTETAGFDTLSDAGADTVGTDAPVQGGEDSPKDTLQGNPDTHQPDSKQPQPDTNQPAGEDTGNPQPKPEDKNEGGGGGGGCAIENPNDPSALNALMTLGAGIAAWALKRRERIRKILER